MSDTHCISERPRSTPFSEYIQRQRNLANAPKTEAPGGRKLWRQMVTGFICAACLGFIMLLLGSIFIGQAVRGENSITIMLCVMGMGMYFHKSCVERKPVFWVYDHVQHKPDCNCSYRLRRWL